MEPIDGDTDVQTTIFFQIKIKAQCATIKKLNRI